MARRIPMVDYLVLEPEPHLEAWESVDSGALYFDRRNADAKSGGTGFRRRPLADTGTVRTFTIVYRGAKEPFVSAVVDLDDGGHVKANIVGVDPDPEQVRLGMPVRLTTYVAGTDDDGTEAIAFGYEPCREETT